MYSSRMHTTHSLTGCHSICLGGGVCGMHAPALTCHTCPLPCMPPLPHMPPAMHAPLATHAPCHACPSAVHTLPCTPPATHASPAMHAPPATHAPCHACPLPCMSPLPCMPSSPAMHAPLPCHASPPPCTPRAMHVSICEQTETCKNITFSNFVCSW